MKCPASTWKRPRTHRALERNKRETPMQRLLNGPYARRFLKTAADCCLVCRHFVGHRDRYGGSCPGAEDRAGTLGRGREPLVCCVDLVSGKETGCARRLRELDEAGLLGVLDAEGHVTYRVAGEEQGAGGGDPRDRGRGAVERPETADAGEESRRFAALNIGLSDERPTARAIV